MSQSPTVSNSHQDKVTRRRRLIKAFETKSLSNRTFTDKFADTVTSAAGSTSFLIINCLIFAVWIAVNQQMVPGVAVFDPFPYGLLTMIVSLEAIILSIFVLLSQNRDAKVSKLRDELHLQVNLIAEEEITKILELLHEMRGKMGIKKEDRELEKMLERIDTSYIERSLQKQIDNNGPKDIINILTHHTSPPSTEK